MTEDSKQLFLDTTIWFGSKYHLAVAIKDNWNLLTSPIVIYEFFKIIDSEINQASQKKREKRLNMLSHIKKRFPQLIEDLDVQILSLTLSDDSIQEVMTFMEQYAIDIGDALNYQLLRKEKISYVLSNDKDWERLPEITLIQPVTDS